MRLYLLIIGGYMAVAGVLLFVKPTLYKQWAKGWMKVKPFRIWAPLLLALGLLMLWAAPASRVPAYIQFLGVLTLLKGILLLAINQEQWNRLMNWWLGLSSSGYRLWGLFSFLMGGAVLLTL